MPRTMESGSRSFGFPCKSHLVLSWNRPGSGVVDTRDGRPSEGERKESPTP